jgi:hypothetical protein
MNTCPFCLKPYAYPLPVDNWYHPPLAQEWTFITNFTPMSPVNYCYGHTFVQCQDCGSLVPYGYHTPESCAVLRGFRHGIASMRASLDEPTSEQHKSAPYGMSRVERLMQETVPLAECLPEHIDVPDAFQAAFAEKEML